MTIKDDQDFTVTDLIVTGGAGFLGSALALRAKDRYSVTLFDNLTRNSLLHLPAEEIAACTLIQGDATDPTAFESLFKGGEIVVHMAAVAGVHNYYRAPFDVMRVNLGGTLNLLAALTVHRPKRLIFVSTSEVYGCDAAAANEDNPLQVGHYAEPRWTYAVSKIAGEKACLAWGKQYGVEVVSLRPFNIYGPGQTGEGAVRDMILTALAGDDLTVHGDGSQVRAWCYIDDFISATLAAMETEGIGGEVFNIGNPAAAVTMNEMARMIVELTGIHVGVNCKPHFGVDIPLRTPDIGKAQRLLAFAPRVGLTEGLRRSIDWYSADER
ncbi:MAG TPA: NAD-dependent epimerase/dehydratase family protein [bacterium]|nr:NAD-dependent epimerase/dehydratase family protein [bacterium]